MTKSSDPYWDELGVAWCAIEPDTTVIASRLERRLRWQSRRITAGLVIGLPLCAAGMLLGVATIVIGLSGVWNFITRGIAIVAMSAILGFALWSLQGVRAGSSTGGLAQMLDRAIDRAQRIHSLIGAGVCSCIIAGVFGLAGTTIRAHFGRPARMSPVIDLVILALVASVLFLYARQVRGDLGRYRALRQTLALETDA